MSAKKKRRFTHRHIDKVVKIMGVVCAGGALFHLVSYFLFHTYVPELGFDSMLYLLYLLLLFGLYVAWRRHLLAVACGLGAILSLLVAYRFLGAGLDATHPFLKWMNVGIAPALLVVFGWMFVWYPLKIIRRVT